MHFNDAEKMAEAHPDTFTICSYTDRSSLKAGDCVKLDFVPDEGEVGYGRRSERMWVMVTNVETVDNIPLYTGVLHNSPYELTCVKHGDVVQFSPRHIYSIETKK
jgi:uncharacterized protein YegJ (DUF2314 family)